MKLIPIMLVTLAGCTTSENHQTNTSYTIASTFWMDKQIDDYIDRVEQEQQVIKVANSNPLLTAASYIGYSESTHRSELRDLTGVDPVRTEWCAAFVNSVLEESNIISNSNHKYPLTARAFLDWGHKVKTPESGDVVVFPRGNQGWQGHVGFFVRSAVINGIEYYYILGGNQDNKVSIEMYPSNKVLGIRRYSLNKG